MKWSSKATLISPVPAVQLANMIFHQAARDYASDVHIEPQEKLESALPH